MALADPDLPAAQKTAAARLQQALLGPLGHTCAAFDADGTLWAGDVGEALLRDLVDGGHVPASAWATYEPLMARDAVAGCGYCVEVMAGLPEALVRERSEAVVRALRHGPLFDETVGLARQLLALGVEVWVVSGSARWVVEAGLRHAGLAVAGICATDCPVVDGKLTGALVLPVPCGPGKVGALRQRTQRPLHLAAGNALYDEHLLRHAAHPVAVGPGGQETALLALARAEGWVVLRGA
jgi:phosphoserine phosphatase